MPKITNYGGPSGQGIPALATEFLRADGTEQPVLQLTGGTMAGPLSPAVFPLVQSAGNVAVDASRANVFSVTLTASGWTVANPVNGTDGQIIRIRVGQDSSGSRTVSWGNAYDWGTGGAAPTLSTAGLVVDVLGFEYNAALAKWMYLSAAFPQGF